MVDYTILSEILLGVIIVIIFGGLLGWWFGKVKHKQNLKNIDAEIHKEEHVKKYIDLYKDAKKSENIREGIQNEHRRKRFLGTIRGKPRTPAEQLGDVKELIRREQSIERKIEQPSSERRIEGRNQLPNTIINENGETKRNSEVNWEDFG